MKSAKALLRFENLRLSLDDERLGTPISWEWCRGERIWIDAPGPTLSESWLALLSGRPPRAGRLHEPQGEVIVQSDAHLLHEAKRQRESIAEQWPLAAGKTLWLDGRRRSLSVALARLDFTPTLQRRSIRLLPPVFQARYALLRLLLSRADLQMVHTLHRSEDSILQRALTWLWDGSPQHDSSAKPTLLVLGGSPPPTHWHWKAQFDAQGRWTLTPSNEAKASILHSSPGAPLAAGKPYDEAPP